MDGSVFHRGIIVEATNHLSDRTYTTHGTGANVTPLTGLLWQRDRHWIDGESPLTWTQAGPDAARLDARLADGHRLAMTVSIDPKTQDIVIRQSGSGPTQGVTGIQWGIAGIDGRRVQTLVPGMSGIRLGLDSPDRRMHFRWPGSWEVQFVCSSAGKMRGPTALRRLRARSVR